MQGGMNRKNTILKTWWLKQGLRAQNQHKYLDFSTLAQNKFWIIVDCCENPTWAFFRCDFWLFWISPIPVWFLLHFESVSTATFDKKI